MNKLLIPEHPKACCCTRFKFYVGVLLFTGLNTKQVIFSFLTGKKMNPCHILLSLLDYVLLCVGQADESLVNYIDVLIVA